MKYAATLFLILMLVPTAQAQDTVELPQRSPKKAFALSLLLPGLGHRYAHHGDWDGGASAFALAEAGFWTSIFVTDARHTSTVESFESLAASRANALIEGKDRRFFLELASYRSSDEYLETQLRNRAWDDLSYVNDPAFQWAWATEDDFQRYRDLRDEADRFRNRRTLLIATLVTNRLLSGFMAARAARRSNAANVSLSVAPPARGATAPTAQLQVRF